jgi:hypothetical protein
MMRPFDQDREEVTAEEEKDWDQAFGDHGDNGHEVKIVRRGYTPSKREVEEHRVTHLPCRDWCEQLCV